jgi:hypothetical protein
MLDRLFAKNSGIEDKKHQHRKRQRKKQEPPSFAAVTDKSGIDDQPQKRRQKKTEEKEEAGWHRGAILFLDGGPSESVLDCSLYRTFFIP